MFKRNKKPDNSVVVDPVAHFAKVLAEELRRAPFIVHHDIKRHIPKPRCLQLWLTDAQGFRWHVGVMDLSYKTSVPILISQHMLTAREEDKGIVVTIEGTLDYDPSDR